ncbi:TrmH family RNA methyltransferase [Zhouia sp. PK063]|uniref:TrmH family RNA methyltransferase n=1 Tax=Zhouia sp. PK063 TaxID=3373602 RepID=UPI00378AD479
MSKLKLLSYLESFVTQERKQKFNHILAQRTKHFTVAIEDIYQAHNTSAVIRSCDVFGVQEVQLIEKRFGKKVDKQIAMGAEKWVDTFRYDDSLNCINTLKKQGYKIVATTPHDDSCMLDDFDITQPAALFFGTERLGLSQEVMSNADVFLKIPMVGFTESLNISVSAAIILQVLTVKLRKSDINWQLKPDEILDKKIDWTKKSIRSVDDVLKRF